MSNTAVTFVSATRTSYDVVTVVTQDSSANTYTCAINLQDSNFPKPNAPTLTTATASSTVLLGTYLVEVSYVDANGETAASSSSSVVIASSNTTTISIASPPALSQGTATGWYAYVSQANGSTLTRQQTFGSPTAIGTALVLSAPPSSSGAAPLAFSADAPVTGLVRALFAA